MFGFTNGESRVRRLLSRSNYSDVAWDPPGDITPTTNERAVLAGAGVNLDRKIRKASPALRRGTIALLASHARRSAETRLAQENAPATPTAPQKLRPELAQAFLVLVGALIFAVDYGFFFTLYLDVFDVVSVLSLDVVNPMFLALLTPVAVVVVALPLGRRWAAWRTSSNPNKLAEHTLTGVLGALLLTLMAGFALAAQHRFDAASIQVGAVSAPTVTVVIVFTLLPLLLVVAHAVVDTPGLRDAAARNKYRRRVIRARRNHDRHYLRLAARIDGLLSTWVDIPMILIEERMQSARANAGVKALPAQARTVADLGDDLARLIPVQGLAIGQPTLPLRRLVEAVHALHLCPLTDTTTDPLSFPAEDKAAEDKAAHITPLINRPVPGAHLNGHARRRPVDDWSWM